MKKHTLLTCINGAVIDEPGDITVLEIAELCQSMHDINHIMSCKIGYPVKCPSCGVIVTVSDDVENSHRLCVECAKRYAESQMIAAKNLKSRIMTVKSTFFGYYR